MPGGNNKNVGFVLFGIAFVCLNSLLMSPYLSDIVGTKKCGTAELVRHHVRVGGEESGNGKTYYDHGDDFESPSPNFPEFKIDALYQDAYNRIDLESSALKCARYGLQPMSGNSPPRRIFYGTMVANENWEVSLMHAVEIHGIYHAAVFVESNTTHMATPRKMKFYDSKEKDLLMHSGMFGKSTRVIFDYWLEDEPDLIKMDREAEQRNTILKVWKKAGMKPEDVGLMADVDEVFSRDFLRAIQVCDFEPLRPGQSCQTPKIVPATITFESSPYCIKKNPWFHPDIIAGECVEGIGDPTERVVPLRNHKRQYGERNPKYGAADNSNYPKEVLKSGRFPLWTGSDIRTGQGDHGIPHSQESKPGHRDTAAYGVAFHFHNWFTDLEVLRNKYLTYAHGDQDIMQKTLSQAHGDLDAFVRCVKGLENSAQPNDWMAEVYDEGWKVKGPKPIYFLNDTYIKERYELVKKMLSEDEKIYGSGYNADGKWVGNSLVAAAEEADKRYAARQKAIKDNKATGTTKSTRRQESLNDGESNSGTSQKRSSPKESVQKTKNLPKSPKNVARKIPVGGHEESRTATVMGMATGLHISELEGFVGSLRRSGFSGHIILGINEDAPDDVIKYLKKRNVTTKIMKYTNCTFEPFFTEEELLKTEEDEGVVKGLTICAEPYPDVKVRWIKFPLGRDWLRECKTCTGPVLVADVRDLYFQDDPFGPGSPEVKGLQVFEEHLNTSTAHWLVDWPVGDCKGVHFKQPMLCSGTTIGTLDAMMKYLERMYEEMKTWLADPKCRFRTLADDQSIHNWLFYNGDLEDAVAVKNRDGTVNTVGFEADIVFSTHLKRMQEEENMSHDRAYVTPLPGGNGHTWISPEIYGMTDEAGFFTNFDGSRSRVVHQFDRAGFGFVEWMEKQDFMKDLGRDWSN